MKTNWDTIQQEQIDDSGRRLAIAMFIAESGIGGYHHDRLPTMFGAAAWAELRRRADTYDWDYGIIIWRLPEIIRDLAAWADQQPQEWAPTVAHSAIVADWLRAYQFPAHGLPGTEACP